MRRILVILVLSAAATSCVKEQSFAERLSNNKNPLTALHADATSKRYENDYWEKQKKLNTSIWVDAAEFCKWHNEYTNCYAVNEVYGPRPELKALAKKHHKRKSKRKGVDKQAQSWTEVERRQKKEAELAVQKEKKEALLGGPEGDNNVVEKDKSEGSSESKAPLINVKNGGIRAKKLSKVKRKKSKSKRRAKRRNKKRRARRKNRKKRSTKQAKTSASTTGVAEPLKTTKN